MSVRVACFSDEKSRRREDNEKNLKRGASFSRVICRTQETSKAVIIPGGIEGRSNFHHPDPLVE